MCGGVGESAPPSLPSASPASYHVPLLQGLSSRLSSGCRSTFLQPHATASRKQGLLLCSVHNKASLLGATWPAWLTSQDLCGLVVSLVLHLTLIPSMLLDPIPVLSTSYSQVTNATPRVLLPWSSYSKKLSRAVSVNVNVSPSASVAGVLHITTLILMFQVRMCGRS